MSSTYSSSEFMPKRGFFRVFAITNNKIGEHRSDRIESAFVSFALGSYYNNIFSPYMHLKIYSLVASRLGETGAGLFPDTVPPVAGRVAKLLFIDKARLGGQETGPSSALFHLSHAVAGGLAGEGG